MRDTDKRYYLDTNILVFTLLSIDMDENIDLNIKKILDDVECIFYTSSIAIFELLHLIKLGKLRKSKKKDIDIDIFVALKASGIKIIPVNEKHFAVYLKLQILEGHKDPFDHMIIAQSISDKIPVISSDSKFPFYENQGLQFVFNKR